MKREAIMAAAIARSRGFDIRSASTDLKMHCHAIAKAALPGANQLIANAVSNHNDTVMRGLAEDRNKACRKAYDEGFADGKRREYSNRWVPMTEGGPWPEEMG